MKTRFGAAAAFLIGALAVAGCGGSDKLYPVEGVVTLDGNPLEGATVSFVGENNKIATGLTNAQGKFKLLSAGQEGAVAGSYKVTVTKVDTKMGGGSGPPPGTEGDPTKAYAEMMKTGGVKMSPKGTMERPKDKSEIPERYGKAGGLPDVVVPTSGSVEIPLKSK